MAQTYPGSMNEFDDDGGDGDDRNMSSTTISYLLHSVRVLHIVQELCIHSHSCFLSFFSGFRARR